MENVPEVQGSNNLEHFIKWCEKLQSLGYSNYFQILNSKDYGIPQNRRRCFMVSIYGDYAYDFPLKLKLKYKLKDFLEKEVDDKYYLSEKMIKYISATNEKWTGNNGGAIVNRTTSVTVNTAPTQRRCDASDYICDDLPENADLRDIQRVADLNYYNHDQSNRVYGAQGCAPSLTTKGNDDARGIKILEETTREGGVMIKENNSQGYKIAEVGDGVNIASRMKHQRGNVQKDSIQTLKAQMEIAVVVDERKDTD